MWLRGRRCKSSTYDSSLTHVGWSDTDIPGSTVTAWYRKDGPRLIILFACSWRASSGLVSRFGGGRRIWEWIGLDWISGDGSITRGLGVTSLFSVLTGYLTVQPCVSGWDMSNVHVGKGIYTFLNGLRPNVTYQLWALPPGDHL